MAPRITVLCGGLGGARLALALQEAGLESRSCFLTNVGDDIVWDGALVCPDTDAVTYSLAGTFDHGRGWGVVGDEPPASGSWFTVGPRDRAHHVRRQTLLNSGLPLSTVTAQLAADLGVTATIIPVTDAAVRTRVRHGGGWSGFQEWLVRDHAPQPEAIAYAGIAEAVPAAGVLAAIRDSDVVVLASSSPVASIDPILNVAGVHAALERRVGRTVAVSPIARRRVPDCERDLRRAAARERLLTAVGETATPVAMAARYADLVDAFVLDPVDACDAGAVGALGVRPVFAPVTGLTAGERAALVELLVAEAAAAAAS